MELKITESAGSDISEVHAYFSDDYFEQNPEYSGSGKRVFQNSWSCFGNNAPYQVGKEREFIAKIDAENPGKYKAYHISWYSCD